MRATRPCSSAWGGLPHPWYSRENLIGVFRQRVLTRVNLGRAYDFQFRHADLSRQACDVFGAERGDGRRAYGSAPRAESSTIIYRRSRAEMPARHEEIEHAEEEG